MKVKCNFCHARISAPSGNPAKVLREHWAGACPARQAKARGRGKSELVLTHVRLTFRVDD